MAIGVCQKFVGFSEISINFGYDMTSALFQIRLDRFRLNLHNKPVQI